MPRTGSLELILIIDDNKDSINMLSENLQKNGYLVTAANHPFKALQLLQRVKPDLILCDILMPDMSGIELTREIQKNPEYQNIPLIFLTGKTDSEDIVQGFAAGGVDYICKPFNQAELLARVRTHLDLKSAQDALANYTQHLKSLNQEKYELLHITAHELRNPLNAISLVAEGLKTAKEPFSLSQLKQLGEAIQVDIKHMLAITRNLLELDQLETQTLIAFPRKLELCQLMARCVEDFKSLAAKRRIDLVCHPPPADCFTFQDPLLLRQMVDNLICNALKFSPSGTQIDVGLSMNENKFIIWIQDQGPGFTLEDKKKLYQKFGRLSARPLHRDLSTGLGLAIVKKLADLLDIQIYLESESGQGAKFELVLEPVLQKLTETPVSNVVS